MLWSAVQKNGKLYCTVTTSESGLGRAGFEGAEWMASVGVDVGVRVWMREGQGRPNHQKKRTRRAAGRGSRMDNDWKKRERDFARRETR